jgi:hypothetical protein
MKRIMRISYYSTENYELSDLKRTEVIMITIFD